MGDPHVRVVGRLADEQGREVIVGVDYDTVTLRTLHTRTDGAVTLASHQAEEFAQMYVAACWEAAAQRSDDMTDAQRAELAAAAEEMCLADRGGPAHDQACRAVPGG